MRLGDQHIRDVLTRAEEIQSHALDGDAMHTELQAVIEAAQEVGIPRAAVERALRERLNLPATPPAAGDLVFAKSADAKFYVAEITSVADDGFGVRFLSGGEHTVALDEIRPCSFMPGERVVVAWPWWGPWTCTVVSYNAAKRRVKVSDGWGETRVFPVAKVWLNPPRTPASGNRIRTRISATLIGTGAILGAALGSMIKHYSCADVGCR